MSIDSLSTRLLFQDGKLTDIYLSYDGRSVVLYSTSQEVIPFLFIINVARNI